MPGAAPTHRQRGGKLNSEAITLLGWGPAILMQLAHPLVAAGVADHSVFLARPDQHWRRFQQTVAAMLALTFGTDEEAARAARRITAIHDRVHGRLREAAGPFPAGTPYAAHDPALLRWVHATLLDTLPRTYECYVGPLTPEERDRYCLEASGIAPLLRIPDGWLPTSVAELQAYLREMLTSGEITVSATARALARDLLAPSGSPLARLGRPLTHLATLGLLPPTIRVMYGCAWTPRHERAFHAATRLVRRTLPLLPAALRQWPAARAAGHRRSGGPVPQADGTHRETLV